MDLQLEVDEDKTFGARATAIIYNKDKTKVLLFKIVDRSYYAVPGGRMEFNEPSPLGVKREIEEELGWNDIDFKFVATGEEYGFNEYRNVYYHQINFVYEGIYKKEITSDEFYGLEGDWCIYKWVDIKDIDKLPIIASKLKDIIKGDMKDNHYICDDRK